MAWREKSVGHFALTRTMKSAWFYGRAGRRLLGMVRRGQGANDGRDFAVTQANMFLDGFSFRQFVEDCYRENARRMKEFDPDLMQPRLLAAIADLAAWGLRLWERRRQNQLEWHEIACRVHDAASPVFHPTADKCVRSLPPRQRYAPWKLRQRPCLPGGDLCHQRQSPAQLCAAAASRSHRTLHPSGEQS